jgi:hypothetical protein
VKILKKRKRLRRTARGPERRLAGRRRSRGFFEGYASPGCKKGFVIYPGKDSFEIKPGITAIPVKEIEDNVRNNLS